MSRLAFVVFVLFAATVLVESRRCRYVMTYALCDKQCCGKESDMYCLDSCVNGTCSADDDCGTGCCTNGKCRESSSNCGAEKSAIIALVVTGLVVTIAVAGSFALICYCRRRRRQPGMVIVTTVPRNITVVRTTDAAPLMAEDHQQLIQEERGTTSVPKEMVGLPSVSPPAYTA